MSPRQLEYFLEVYRCKSIKKAAKNLIISTQAVSKAIKEIEKELNVELFVRGKKQLEPTNQAERLKFHTIRILKELSEIHSIKNDIQQEETITIYSIDGFLSYVSVDFVETFHNAYPNIILNIVETTEKAIVKLLKEREIDMAILTTVPDIDIFHSTYLYSSQNCLVINKTHPLAQKETISLMDLDNQLIAGKGTEYSCYSFNLKKALKNGINLNIILETTNDSMILQMAERGLAIGITLDYIASAARSENTVIRFLEEEGYKCNVFWIENRYTTLSLQQQMFKTFLLKWLKKHKEEST